MKDSRGRGRLVDERRYRWWRRLRHAVAAREAALAAEQMEEETQGMNAQRRWQRVMDDLIQAGIRRPTARREGKSAVAAAVEEETRCSRLVDEVSSRPPERVPEEESHRGAKRARERPLRLERMNASCRRRKTWCA